MGTYHMGEQQRHRQDYIHAVLSEPSLFADIKYMELEKASDKEWYLFSGTDKVGIWWFSIFLHKNGEAILMSTYNIMFFMENWRKLSLNYHQTPSLSVPLISCTFVCPYMHIWRSIITKFLGHCFLKWSRPTWSEHQYQIEFIVTPIIPGQGRSPSMGSRNKCM